MTDWKQSFLESIEQGSVDGVVKALDSQLTKHAGTAPAKIKREAIKLVQKITSDALYPLILALCGYDSPTAQEVGAVCITDFYPSQSTEVNSALYRLANSDNWEVREWVATACGLLLERHFHAYLPIMVEWSKDSSEKVRRAVVLAVMYAGRSRNPEFIGPILDVLEPLLSDRSRYVRDNLGPFAIGSALAKYYPVQVLNRLDTWIDDEDEQVRWNVAMVFSAANGAKLADDSHKVMDTLLSDKRPYVKRAVDKAMKVIQHMEIGS